MAELTKF